MKLKPKLALQATLYLALLVGLIVLIVRMPDWAFAAVMLPLALGWLWFLIYRSLEMQEAARKAALETRREADKPLSPLTKDKP
jgi:hypothetical protein